MIVSAYQPFFAPFPAFIAKALLSDLFVLFDSVQFPNSGTWLTRNRFKHDQGELRMTIPVVHTGGPERIDEVRICRGGNWARKHLASLRAAYGRAPFFEEHEPLLAGLFEDPPERLIDFNLAILGHLFVHFGVKARVVRLSALGIAAREPHLSVAVCRRLGGSIFLAQRAAEKFLGSETFATAGLELRTFAYHPEIYPQLYGPFIQNLSAFDLLFTCGPKAPGVLRSWLRPPAP
ncbi:MAG TPA: WbqC family protein [Candidatus Methanoperedens sp.]|nr:WbqC family protein [Candidatus Methanoperedens sp.]